MPAKQRWWPAARPSAGSAASIAAELNDCQDACRASQAEGFQLCGIEPRVVPTKWPHVWDLLHSSRTFRFYLKKGAAPLISHESASAVLTGEPRTTFRDISPAEIVKIRVGNDPLYPVNAVAF
jgi:hypothetical protein